MQTKEEIINQIKERLKAEFVPLFHEDGKSARVGYSKKTKVIYKDIDALIDDHYRDDIKTEEERNTLHKLRLIEWSEQEAKREFERFEKAKKIKYSEWPGEQFYDGEDYHPDIETFFEAVSETFGFDYEKYPKYVWATKKKPYITEKDAFGIYENDLEDLSEECDWPVEGVKDLQEALNEFVESNEDNVAYWPDYTIALLIDDQIKEWIKRWEE